MELNQSRNGVMFWGTELWDSRKMKHFISERLTAITPACSPSQVNMTMGWEAEEPSEMGALGRHSAAPLAATGIVVSSLSSCRELLLSLELESSVSFYQTSAQPTAAQGNLCYPSLSHSPRVFLPPALCLPQQLGKACRSPYKEHSVQAPLLTSHYRTQHRAYGARSAASAVRSPVGVSA